MLVTDPKQRASLQEIMNHPWMTKGFGSGPENYLPAREPLQMPLDPEVIHAMTGFDFGPAEVIQSQMAKVIESEEYQRAVRNFAAERGMQQPNNGEKKRGFAGFDFYKRRNSTTSRDTLTMPSTEGLGVGADPINAFNPLISVYYLVREKQERDRQLANPGATSMPRSPGEAPLQQVPDLAPPKAAHTNAAAYEMPGEKPTGGRSRPRARTHGEDEVTDAMKHVRIAGSGAPPSPAAPELPTEHVAKKESAAAGLLRRFSTRKRREPERERTDRSHPPPVVRVNAPGEVPATPRKSFSVRRTRDKERSGTSATDLRPSVPPKDGNEMLSPPRSSDPPKNKIGRSASVNSTISRRPVHAAADSVPRVTYTDAPTPSGSEGERSPHRDDVEHKTNHNTRSGGGATRAKSLGHARRESIQARRARREEAREANVPEETDGELAETSERSAERIEESADADIAKPVYLKGLFSVSTTSTKPVQTIRADIIRVLKQLGVEYSEIRGGFSCRHVPSIDLNKVVDNVPTSPQTGTGFGQGGGAGTPGHRRKISFGGFMGGGDRDEFREREAERQAQIPKMPRRSMADRHDRSYSNSEASDESIPRDHSRRPAAGETTTHVQSDLGGSMVLQFEIFVVKVPLLSLHGIQFKRLAGGTWQYKGMAEAILRELKL